MLLRPRGMSLFTANTVDIDLCLLQTKCSEFTCKDGTQPILARKDATCAGEDCQRDCCAAGPVIPKRQCSSFSCPAQSSRLSGSDSLECGDDVDCMKVCCEEDKPDQSCSTFTCPADYHNDPANNEKRCRGTACVATCCVKPPSPAMTCGAFIGSLPPADRAQCKLPDGVTEASACVEATCHTTCCAGGPPPDPNLLPCVRFWLVGGDCPKPSHRRRSAAAKRCKLADCPTTCCRDDPDPDPPIIIPIPIPIPDPDPKPNSCAKFWVDHSCRDGKVEKEEARTKRCTTTDDCQQACCKPPPEIFCKSFACPRDRKRLAGSDETKCVEADCLGKCCEAPPIDEPVQCLTFWKTPGCPAGKLSRLGKDQAECLGAECETECCYSDGPVTTCQSVRCPLGKRLIEALRSAECSGEECESKCCELEAIIIPPGGTTCEAYSCPAGQDRVAGKAGVKCLDDADCLDKCCIGSKTCQTFACPPERPKFPDRDMLKCLGDVDCLANCCMPPRDSW